MAINWKHVRHFSRDEFGDPLVPESGELIDGKLVLLLDKMREETKYAIITHAAVGGCVDVDGLHGHSSNSYHLKLNGCKAVDFHFAERKSFKPLSLNPRLQYEIVENYRFSGIGVYHDWHCDGYLLPIGFHVDLRPIDKFQRWVRRAGSYIYLLGR